VGRRKGFDGTSAFFPAFPPHFPRQKPYGLKINSAAGGVCNALRRELERTRSGFPHASVPFGQGDCQNGISTSRALIFTRFFHPLIYRLFIKGFPRY
jgi:hypothetical protein